MKLPSSANSSVMPGMVTEAAGVVCRRNVIDPPEAIEAESKDYSLVR